MNENNEEFLLNNGIRLVSLGKIWFADMKECKSYMCSKDLLRLILILMEKQENEQGNERLNNYEEFMKWLKSKQKK